MVTEWQLDMKFGRLFKLPSHRELSTVDVSFQIQLMIFSFGSMITHFGVIYFELALEACSAIIAEQYSQYEYIALFR